MTDDLNSIRLEFELVPIARAMSGIEVDEMRKISPAWCLRKEAVAIYALAQKTSDADLLPALTRFLSEDPYLMPAVRHMTEAPPTEEIRQKMYEDWRSRTEKELLSKYNEATTVQQKAGYLTAILSLFNQSVPNAYVVDVAYPSPPEDFLLAHEGVSFIPKGDITTIKAKAKSGKTQLVKQIIAALISPNGICNGLTNAKGTPCRIFWMDTEQSFCSSDMAYKSVLRLAGLPDTTNNDNLRLINTRMLGYKERLDILKYETRGGSYDLVVIDGIKDLVKNINDPGETDNIISEILRLTQTHRFNLLCVIHENPRSDEDKMRGWLGTELANKSFEVFEVSIDQGSGVFTVKNSERREKTVPSFGFQFDENDNLVSCEPIEQGQGQGQKRETKEERDWNLFVRCFEKNWDLALTKEEIVNEHLRLNTLKESTAKNRIKSYFHQKRLVSNGPFDEKGTRFGLSTEEKIKIRERLAGPPEDQDLPF